MAEETKKRKTYYNDKTKDYTIAYIKENLDEIKFRVPKGKRQYYKDAAAAAGMSLVKFIVSSMDERIEREGLAEKIQHLDSAPQGE